MTLTASPLPRAFRYNSVDLPDPGAQFSPEQVRDFYAATYPEIVSAGIDGPEEADGTLRYTFRRAVGTKGARRTRTGSDVPATLAELLGRRAEGHAAQTCAGTTLAPADVAAEQPAFAAWARFAEGRRTSRGGIADAAPAPAPLLGLLF